MNKQIITITLGILLLNLVSSYYAGETINVTNELRLDDLGYTIVDNSTQVNLDINVSNELITIHFPEDMIPDNFKIVFIELKTNTITQTVKVGGGGGSSRTVYKNNTINETVYVPKIINQTQLINHTEYIKVTDTKECSEQTCDNNAKNILVYLFLFLIFLVLVIISFNYLNIKRQ